MEKNREKIEKRILDILSYLKNDKLVALFRDNPSIFSLEDLEMILGFLETWENNFLGDFLEKISKDCSLIDFELTNIEVTSKKRKTLENERKEKKEEEEEILKYFNF